MIRDISNIKFGLTTAIEPTGDKKWGVSLWRCACQCGREHIAAVNSLKSGLVKSCGCLKGIVARGKESAHGLRGTPAYKSWDSMIQRCLNKNSTSYKRYGEAGISVCDKWRDFPKFLEDMGERPPGTSLDRIDPFGNYEAGNCRWATPTMQSRNKKNKITTFEQAEQVRLLRSQGISPIKIATIVGITFGSVSGIIYLGQISKPD